MAKIFDHRLTTTVQGCCKTPKKPVVITDNGLFLVLGAAVQDQQILRFIVSLYRPVAVLRRHMPGLGEASRVHRMNSFRNRAEEIVLHELVYDL